MLMKKFKRSKEEYLFIRQEMLQYLNNYQSVRNMMYVSTLACLGLGIFSDFEDSIIIGEHFLFLLALAVIMPTFLSGPKSRLTKGTCKRLEEMTGTLTAAAISFWNMTKKPQLVVMALQPAASRA